MLLYKMDDVALIELVRKNSMLYDVSHPKYMNLKNKATIWKGIGEKLHVASKQCKNRWGNIRDHFKKHLSGRGRARNKKYKYETILQFLVPFLNDKQLKPLETEIEPEILTKIEVDDSDSLQNDTDKEESPPSPTIRWLKPTVSILNNDTENRDAQHPIDAFLAGIGATIKTLSVYHQHLAKGRIFAIVQDLELKELQNNG